MTYGSYFGSRLDRSDALDQDLIFICDECECEWPSDVRQRDGDRALCPTCFEEKDDE